MHREEGRTETTEAVESPHAAEEELRRRPLRRTSVLSVAAVGTLLLSSCVGLETPEAGEGGDGEAEQVEEEPPTLAEFCAEEAGEADADDDLDDDADEDDDDVEAAAVDDDEASEDEDEGFGDPTGEDRVIDPGDNIMETEEIPLPYLEQLEADDEYAAASEEAPAENVPEPEIPALVCDDGEDGAAAALSYWYETYWYGDQTGDSTRMEEMHGVHCGGCDTTIEEIQNMGEADQWMVSEPVQPQLHYWDESEEDDDVLQATVTQDIPTFTYYDEDGEVEEHEGGETEYTVEMTFDEDSGHWLITDQLEAQLGGPDPEAEEPSMPAGAESDAAEGAWAAHEYWMKALTYAMATGDAEAIQSMEHPDGEDWSVFYTDFVDLYSQDGWMEFEGEVELDDPEVHYEDLYDPDLDEEVAFVFGYVDEPEATIYEADGEEANFDDVTDEPVTYIYFYNDEAGHWVLYDLIFDDLSELEDELGDPDYTP